MNIAKFEKVSKEQFKKDCLERIGTYDDINYEDIVLPIRATKGSAGYDFFCPFDIDIRPKEHLFIPSGIRVKIDEGYVLNLYPRSSLGFKYQLMLANTVGIIDSDYYEAKNEGHIIVALINNGNKILKLNKGDRFVQGVFLAYYLAKEENYLNDKRLGGYGSSGK